MSNIDKEEKFWAIKFKAAGKYGGIYPGAGLFCRMNQFEPAAQEMIRLSVGIGFVNNTYELI